MDRDSKTVMTEIMEVFAGMDDDAEVWEDKGTKAAAGRLRKATSNLEKLGKEFRKLSIAEGKK